MKDLFNDMSSEEKNDIRGQHTGGKKLTIENFSNMVSKKLGEVPTFLSEQMEESNLPIDNPKVELIIQMLKDLEVDGETMQYIMQQVSMEDQMQSQLDYSSEFDNKFKGTTPDDIDF
jgi:hypothetical protein